MAVIDDLEESGSSEKKVFLAMAGYRVFKNLDFIFKNVMAV